jgi:hypothetical protein
MAARTNDGRERSFRSIDQGGPGDAGAALWFVRVSPSVTKACEGLQHLASLSVQDNHPQS